MYLLTLAGLWLVCTASLPREQPLSCSSGVLHWDKDPVGQWQAHSGKVPKVVTPSLLESQGSGSGHRTATLRGTPEHPLCAGVGLLGMAWVALVGLLGEGHLASTTFVHKFATTGVFLPAGLASQALRLQFCARSPGTCHAQYFPGAPVNFYPLGEGGVQGRGGGEVGLGVWRVMWRKGAAWVGLAWRSL